uniref:FP protein C-terminal domain-containing protein n=1 Tax=Heliothis virescens TaxID=7102 RepID=A0A2A4IUX2_HELVI
MTRVQRSPPTNVKQNSMPKSTEPSPSTSGGNNNINIGDDKNVSVRNTKRPRLSESSDDCDKQNEVLDELTDHTLMTHPNLVELISKLREDIESVVTIQIQSSLKLYFENQLSELTKVVHGLKDSIQFMSNDFDDMKIELAKNKDLVSQLQKENEDLKTNVADLSVRLNIMEQQSRQDNIELNGIPENQAENLITTVIQLGKTISCDIQAGDITSVTRVKKLDSQSSRPRSIIVKLKNSRKRDEVLASVTKFNRTNSADKLNTRHLGYAGTKSPVFVSEHLSPLNKSIHAQARKVAREKGYKYVWVRDGRVLVRKDDGARAVHIKSLQSANML